jgi:hypothetical protein
MKLAFYKGNQPHSENSQFFDKAICLWTRSPYSHVEMIFDASEWPRGMLAAEVEKQGKTIQPGDPLNWPYIRLCFSSSPRDGGVRFKWIDIDPAQWDVREFPMPGVNDLNLIDAAAPLVGLKYDWFGIFGFVLPFGEHNDADRFCSEVCLDVIQKFGDFRQYKAWEVSPGQLSDFIGQLAPKAKGAAA